MAEEQKTEEVVNEPIATETVEVPKSDGLATALADSFFNATPVNQNMVEAKPKEEVPTTKEPEETEEIFDEADYLKDFGWESKDKGKEEIKTLREKAAQAEKGFEWKNDYSKQVAEIINGGEDKEEELFNILNTKRQLKKLATSEINDIKLASELVKFGIQNENKDAKLSPDEVEFLFNERYNIPEKPVQTDLEDDTEYNQRVSAWQTQVQNIERRMIIEAKIQQPKLASYNNELVLPKIERENQQTQQQVSQEDLDKVAKFKDSYLQSVDNSLKSLASFNLTVKDKDVEIPLKYDLTADQKSEVAGRMKHFAESGYNATAILADLWVNENGEVKTDEMAKDLAYLLFKDTINQKFANDAAGKRLDLYLQSKKNININSQQQQGTFAPKTPKSEPEAVTEAWLNMR